MDTSVDGVVRLPRIAGVGHGRAAPDVFARTRPPLASERRRLTRDVRGGQPVAPGVLLKRQIVIVI